MALLSLALSLTTGCADVWSSVFSRPGDGTQFSDTSDPVCDVSYYDNEFAYGFDLPSEAELSRIDNEQDAQANTLWTVSVDGVLVNLITRVSPANGETTLGVVVQSTDDEAVMTGANLLLEQPVTLANGGEGFESILDSEGLTTFRVQTIESGHLFTVEAAVASDARTEAIDTFLADTVRSLCAD